MYYYWEFYKKRKNESTINNMPLIRISKHFATKNDAIEYCKINKANWIQGRLMLNDGLMSYTFGVCDINQHISIY